MKIIGICCSPRKGKTTFEAMNTCMDSAKEVSDKIETQIIELAGKTISPCIDCGICKKQLTCSRNDDFNELIPTLSDKSIVGVIIATPVYVGNMTAQCKVFIDRSVIFRRNGWLFCNKVGGALAVGGVRNGGQELTIQSIHAAMMCHDMICVSDGKDTAHFGAALLSNPQDGIDGDDLGLATARNLGRRVAELAVKINS